MATDAIIVNHFLASLMNEDDLGFKSQGKHGGMAHTVFGLEKVFVEYIVVGHMAIVAVGIVAVRSMRPGGILRGHNMAIDAGLRVIRQIGMCLTDVKQKKEEPGKNSYNDQYRKPPGLWWQ